MNSIIADITSVAMAIVGVAILSVIVSRQNNTVGVLGAASSGFAQVLGVAMGPAAGVNPTTQTIPNF